MKNILRLLCVVIAFASSGLLAQESSAPLVANGDSSSAVRHVGGAYIPGPELSLEDSPFAIGYPDNPVTAEEYAAFLNTMAFKDHSWFNSDYYEPFMATDQDWFNRPEATIQRTGKYSPYHYSVLPGHETDIIDSVTSEYVRCTFSWWRMAPTDQELCDYINDKEEGRDEEAEDIRDRYWSRGDLMGEVTHHVYSHVPSQVYDEQNRPVFNLSKESNNDPLHATVVEGMEYCRPSKLNWKTL